MATITRIDKNNKNRDYGLYFQEGRLVFKRNNLDIDSFSQTEMGWKYEEEFFYYGTWCHLRVEGSKPIKSYFPTNEDTFVLKGGYHGFGIQIFADVDNNPPFTISRILDSLIYVLECRGKKKLAIKNKDGSISHVPLQKGRPKGRERAELPASAWSVAHPYQGGSSSPK